MIFFGIYCSVFSWFGVNHSGDGCFFIIRFILGILVGDMNLFSFIIFFLYLFWNFPFIKSCVWVPGKVISYSYWKKNNNTTVIISSLKCGFLLHNHFFLKIDLIELLFLCGYIISTIIAEVDGEISVRYQ